MTPASITDALADPSAVGPAERRLDLLSAVLLALAALATAWAAYQSRQWTGEQSTGYSKATTARLTENRSAALANRQVQIDVATFTQWLNARAQHDDALARFYSVRFRPEFQPAFAAWLATEPLRNANAPVSSTVGPTGGTCRDSATGISHIRSRAPGGAWTSASRACGG